MRSNVQYDYKFDIGLVKTSTGTIQEASSSDINDLSLDIQLYLSRDMVVSDDDYRIKVETSIDQQTHQRRGKGTSMISSITVSNCVISYYLNVEPV